MHNLRGLDWGNPGGGFPWAERFDDAVRATMAEAPAEVLTVDAREEFRLAVPTPDHFLPLVYLAGLAAAGGHTTKVLVDGYTFGAVDDLAHARCRVPGPCGDLTHRLPRFPTLRLSRQRKQT